MGRLRHVVNTESLVKMNASLTPKQKKCLRMTPFKSLIDLEKRNKISCVLLKELVHRWDIHSHGIRVGNRIISFTTLDVCVGLGLRIVGEPVHVDDGNESRVKDLFNGGVITVSTIVEKMGELTDDNDVEDFCRLYILLAFKTLYFPKTTTDVHTLPFRLLNDLGSLCKYNWGGEVYRVLVSSLDRVAPRLNEGKNKDSFYIAGCAELLQIWTVDHLSLRDSSKKTRFPRLLDWIDVGSGKCLVTKIFDPEKVVEDLPLNDEDCTNEVVIEVIENVQRGCSSQKKRLSKKQKDIGMRLSMIEDELKVATKADGSKDIVGKRSELNKSLVDLYRFCTRRVTTSNRDETLVDLKGNIITRSSLTTFSPRSWVDNFVFAFTSLWMMEEEINRTGVVSRFVFNSFFAEKVIRDIPMFQNGSQKRWTLKDYCHYQKFPGKPIYHLRSSNLIFAPAVFNGHWVCYVLNKHEMKMYVLDSLEHERDANWYLLDLAMCSRFEELLSIILQREVVDNAVKIHYENLPKQHNCHDCGIYVLKYLELWNGENTMPYYSEDDVLKFRREYVLKWVLDERNTFKEKVLADANVPEHLMY